MQLLNCLLCHAATDPFGLDILITKRGERLLFKRSHSRTNKTSTEHAREIQFFLSNILPWEVYSLDENHFVDLDTASGHTYVPRVLPCLAVQSQVQLQQ